jgi:hypothetical protein
MDEIRKGKSLAIAAARADMDDKTARKYVQLGRLPSECAAPHTWRTRQDPFDDVWDELCKFLKDNPRLQAKTLFQHLQRQFPGRYQDGQLRTLQRRVKLWHATQGPGHEVFFPQDHHPAELGASDFTRMSALRVTIAGQPFPHMLYHFVLTYSNWETVSLCFSESFEALADGLQNALFELGCVPKAHRTDRLTAAVLNLRRAYQDQKLTKKEARALFTRRYEALLDHYHLRPAATQPGHGNENGDAEQRHYRIKDAIDQALLLRGSRDFDSRQDYEAFLRTLLCQLNAGRQARLAEELPLLGALPPARLDTLRRLDVRVGPASTVYVLLNVYSVPSRLIGEKIQAQVGAETIGFYYGQTRVETAERLCGRGRHHIDYRHIIDWLVRKPGAFANYRYKADLFPTSRFRMAYDLLCQKNPERADRHYLRLLELAAKEGQSRVEEALAALMDSEAPLEPEEVLALVKAGSVLPGPTDVTVEAVDLSVYDALLDRGTDQEEPPC